MFETVQPQEKGAGRVCGLQLGGGHPEGGHWGRGWPLVVEGARVLATGNATREVRIDGKEIETPRGRGGFVCALRDEMGRGEGEPFMTQKGKLIITQFGFVSGQHKGGARPESWRREGPPGPSPGGRKLRVPFLLFQVRDCANGANKSLDASGIESCPHTEALFLEPGRWGQVLRSAGRFLHPPQQRKQNVGGAHFEGTPLPVPLPPRTQVGSLLTISIGLLSYDQPLPGWPPPRAVGRAALIPRYPTHPDYLYVQISGIFNALPTTFLNLSRSLRGGVRVGEKRRMSCSCLNLHLKTSFLFKVSATPGPCPGVPANGERPKGKGEREKERGWC